jgi:hypothetical protein
MIATVRRSLLWVAALVAGTVLSGCKDDAYCFVCEHNGGTNTGGNGVTGQGGFAATFTDGGSTGGDGGGFNVGDGSTSCGVPDNIANCGVCGNRCERFGALATCDTSGATAQCKYDCAVGYVDLNGDLSSASSDGCEYECLQTNGGTEICDGIDNDCNGKIDEGLDTNNDVNNCGACGTPCSVPHASPACVGGVCQVAQCLPGWWDIDKDPTHTDAAGCEYYCQPTGPEICDGIDNDCDKLVDDADPDVAVQSDVRHCGSCDNNCEGQVPNAVAACVNGACTIGNCLQGFFDKDPAVPGCEASCSNADCSFPFAFANCDDKGTCTMGGCLPNYYDLDPQAPGCEYYCVPSGAEVCDGKDNDCDGLVDQADPDVQTSSDPLNCGQCGKSCAGAFANSLPVCQNSQCVLSCINGYVDVDNDPTNGCEFNCDACFFPNATADDAACVLSGKCVFGGCLPGYVDTDPNVPGCEYQCTPTAPPTEVCDGKDNDCNGKVDDGVTLTPQNCGGCGRDCSLFFPNSNTSCTLVNGVATCGFVSCKPGYGNVDGVTQNGCEYLCTPTTPATEVCDGKDNDCNGVVDDVAPGSLPDACAGSPLATGECDATTECLQISPGVYGPKCVQTKGPTTEVCDGKDNNCNGQIDENTAQNPLPGVGIQCGTQQGECTFGTRACQNGALVCTGGQGPVAEVCDGKDNDCNGLVDDLASTTCGSSVGACKTGTSQCVAGVSVCTGSVAPSTEVCDGNGSTAAQYDNNCNGQVDEGCVQVSGQPARHDRGGVNGSTASNTGQHSTFQLTSATAGNDFLVAYADARDGAAHIYGFGSTDGGQTWTQRADATLGDVLIANGGDPRVEPQAFMRAGRGYVVYTAFNAFSGGAAVRRIVLRAANAPYTTWGNEVRVDNTANDTGLDLYTPRGVVAKAAASGNGDTLAVVWNQIGGTSAAPQRDVYLSYSKDGGATWSAALPVNANDHKAELPAIATDGAGEVFVTWRSGGTRVAFRRIDLTAATPAFEASFFLQPNVANVGSDGLGIAADATGNVHVVWTDLRSTKKTVRVASATKCGQASNAATCSGSFTQVAAVTDGIIVSTGAVTDDAFAADIAAHSGQVIVAWQDTRSGASDIRLNRASFTAGAWNWLAEPQRVDTGDGPGATTSLSPHVAFGQGSNVFVTWQDLRNPASAVYANVSIDGGTTIYNGAGATALRIDAFTNATAAAADSSSPFVLATPNANRAVVVFLDFHDASNNNGLNGDVYTELLQ